MAVTATQLTKQKDFISENWKPIVGFTLAGTALFLGWRIYKNSQEPEIEDLSEDKRFPPATITDSQAQNRADMLHTAMTTLFKVDEDEFSIVLKALEGLTYNDYVKVSDMFGMRRYVDATGIGQTWPATERNLSYWLSKELTPKQQNEIRKVHPNIL